MEPKHARDPLDHPTDIGTSEPAQPTDIGGLYVVIGSLWNNICENHPVFHTIEQEQSSLKDESDISHDELTFVDSIVNVYNAGERFASYAEGVASFAYTSQEISRQLQKFENTLHNNVNALDGSRAAGASVYARLDEWGMVLEESGNVITLLIDALIECSHQVTRSWESFNAQSEAVSESGSEVQHADHTAAWNSLLKEQLGLLTQNPGDAGWFLVPSDTPEEFGRIFMIVTKPTRAHFLEYLADSRTVRGELTIEVGEGAIPAIRIKDCPAEYELLITQQLQASGWTDVIFDSELASGFIEGTSAVQPVDFQRLMALATNLKDRITADTSDAKWFLIQGPTQEPPMPIVTVNRTEESLVRQYLDASQTTAVANGWIAITNLDEEGFSIHVQGSNKKSREIVQQALMTDGLFRAFTIAYRG